MELFRTRINGALFEITVNDTRTEYRAYEIGIGTELCLWNSCATDNPVSLLAKMADWLDTSADYPLRLTELDKAFADTTERCVTRVEPFTHSIE